MDVVLEDVRVEGVVAIRRVVQARRHAGFDQRGDLRQIETDDSVVDRRTGISPRLPAPAPMRSLALRAVSSRNRATGLSTLPLSGSGFEDLSFLEETLARELVGIVEDHGDVAAAAHRQRLVRVDVDQEIRRRFGRDGIGEAAHPSVFARRCWARRCASRPST